METKVSLRSHDRWAEVADFEIESRILISKYIPEKEEGRRKISGTFGTIDSDVLIVRLVGSRLFIGFERCVEFPFRESKVEHETFDGQFARFKIEYGEYTKEVRYYFGTRLIPGEELSDYQAEIEDFDFGLWVVNIWNCTERQNVLIDRWK